MTSPSTPAFVHDDLADLGIDVSAAMLDRLAAYLDRLLDQNQRMNLTGVRQRDEAWSTLIIDSLTLLPWLENLPENARVIDVGTGGGLPGIPLAICRPDLAFTLLDATGKKVRFVLDLARELGLDNVWVIQDRAETLGRNKACRERFDMAVSRAVGPMPVVLECCLPLVRVEGTMLAMKGPKAQAELEASGDALARLGAGEVWVYDAYPEGFANDRVIVAVSKAGATPRQYPRAAGVPKQTPL